MRHITIKIIVHANIIKITKANVYIVNCQRQNYLRASRNLILETKVFEHIQFLEDFLSSITVIS